RCGADLPPYAPEGLCPGCLLEALAAPVSDVTGADLTTEHSSGERSSSENQAPRLISGQTFGPYRIERLLGRGGMGEVYEAEHLEQARRVALKVLRQGFANTDDRARFMCEGQLAASVNHPNSVYIFGSE